VGGEKVAKRSDIIIAVIIVVSFLIISLLTLFAFVGLSEEGSILFAGLGERVAIVDVHGVIKSSSEVNRQLRKYGEDGSIPAVVLHIDSPGGGAAASQEIHEEIGKLREKGKKVIASMGSVAASGGYYIACAADTIVANPATLTGSIGVIFQFAVFEELFKKVGVKYEVVKRGEIKDIGSMDRSMTERERKSLQSVVDDTYDQFVDVIVAGRDLERDQVLKIADGSIFTGSQARELGLVDELGNLHDAIKIAGEMVGMEEYPKTIKERKKKISWFDVLTQRLGDLLELDQSETMMPRLEYIFK
jgi:protease-4